MTRAAGGAVARAAIALCALGTAACRGGSDLRVVTTTSVETSGLLGRLTSGLGRDTGLRVAAVVAGSGQALAVLVRGDADVALTHDPEGERRLVVQGVAERHPVARNDFVLVGPPADPAGARAASGIDAALRAIAGGGHAFVSRGDRSGTHAAELRLWAAAGVDPAGARRLETGAGQAHTLRVAAERGGYALCDLATFLGYTSHDPLGLSVLRRGEAGMENTYSILIPRWLAGAARERAERLLSWVRGPAGRAALRPGFDPVEAGRG